MRTTAEAINEIEGYLLWEAEKDKARARAGAFASRMPWLTESQQAEVERVYAQDQLEVSRAYLKRIASRSGELRAEYEGVYHVLRRRLLVAFLGAFLVGMALVTATVVAAMSR